MSERLSLWQYLRTPRQELRRVAAVSRPPWITWFWLVGIAVGGSCIYGASLSMALRGWQAMHSAIWLALCAGLGWCVFFPVLLLVTGRGMIACGHACLVTMAYGEAVLLVGALVNLAITMPHPAALNFAIVALSNVVMATALTLQLRALGVRAWPVLAAWLVILDGSGALFFWSTWRWLKGAA